MIIISIDGATRRPGKPDCLAAGAVYSDYGIGSRLIATHEKNSTNQRGELLGLIAGLKEALRVCEVTQEEEFYLITDSEYVFNCVTKQWYINWHIKGWLTAEGTPVKNQDLWKQAAELLGKLIYTDIDIVCYHVKGHLVSVGKVTAAKSLDNDPSGGLLYKFILDKYPEAQIKYKDKHEKARKLFRANHGHDISDEVFKKLVLCNTLVDLYAGYYIDQVDKGLLE